MTRPAPRTVVRCTHCTLPILRQGRLWVHDTPRRNLECLIDSQPAGTYAQPEETP